MTLRTILMTCRDLANKMASSLLLRIRDWHKFAS